MNGFETGDEPPEPEDFGLPQPGVPEEAASAADFIVPQFHPAQVPSPSPRPPDLHPEVNPEDLVPPSDATKQALLDIARERAMQGECFLFGNPKSPYFGMVESYGEMLVTDGDDGPYMSLLYTTPEACEVLQNPRVAIIRCGDNLDAHYLRLEPEEITEYTVFIDNGGLRVERHKHMENMKADTGEYILLLDAEVTAEVEERRQGIPKVSENHIQELITRLRAAQASDR